MVQSAQQTVTAQELSDRLGGKKQGKGFLAHCPCHDDQHASLSIADGDNGTILLYCHAGCKYQDIRDALGLSSRRAEDGQRLVDIYAYQDEEGQLSYEVRRYQLPDGSKDFRQRPAKASPMGPWKMAGIKPLPFDLPRLLGAVKEGRTIYYVEGEKDAQTLHKLGLFATTNHGGANKPGIVGGIAPYFDNANVIIVPDNDVPGRTHARNVYDTFSPRTHSIGISLVPAPYKDVTEWIEAEGQNALADLVANIREWQPSDGYFAAPSPSAVEVIGETIGETPDRAIVEAAAGTQPITELRTEIAAAATALVSTAIPPRQLPVAPRLQLRSYADLIAMPPVTYLDERHELVRYGLNVLYARRGTGKSFMALDYSLKLAQTEPVVYVAGEGISGYPDRVAAWLKHHEADATQFRFIDQAVSMLRPDEVTALITVVAPLKPALIVLDTLARCMAGGDENTTVDMSRFVAACDFVRRETGAALLIIHHTGKVANGTRGSIVLEDGADMVIALAGDRRGVKVSCAKAKDSIEFETRYVKLLTTEARPGNTSCVVIPSEPGGWAEGEGNGEDEADTLTPSQITVLQTLAECADLGATFTEIGELSQLAEKSITRAMPQLLEAGYISHERKGRGSRYSITETGLRVIQDLLEVV